MSKTFEKIRRLHETDFGREPWTQSQLLRCRAAWRELSPEHRTFLQKLTDQELESINLGPVRKDHEGREVPFYHGKWQRLPVPVEAFVQTCINAHLEG